MMMTQEMTLTVHAQQRMKTRSINKEIVELILEEGERRPSREGERCQLTENKIEELEGLMYLPLPRDKLARVYVIVCHGHVVTVAHEYPGNSSYFSVGARAKLH